jgi:hypothetical protein
LGFVEVVVIHAPYIVESDKKKDFHY